MTHNELVELAKDWVLTAKGCNPVFCERGSSKTGEKPDVIGWNSQGGILVECKASMADFRADLKKPFRINPEKGMGRFRYYFLEPEFYKEIPEEKIPDGWGIVLTRYWRNAPGQVRGKGSKEWAFDMEAELYYLRNRILEAQKIGR